MNIAYLNSQQHHINELLRNNKDNNCSSVSSKLNNVLKMASQTNGPIVMCDSKAFDDDSESLLVPAQMPPFHATLADLESHRIPTTATTTTAMAAITPIPGPAACPRTAESRPERNLWHLDEILHMLAIMKSINAVDMLNDKTVKSEHIFRKVEQLMHNSGFRKKSHVQILTKWKFLKSTYTTTRRNGTIPKMISYQVYQALTEMLSGGVGPNSRSANSSECGNSVASMDASDMPVHNSMDPQVHPTMLMSAIDGACYGSLNKNNSNNPLAEDEMVAQAAENSLSMEHPIFGYRLGVVKQELADTGYETGTTDNGHTGGNTTAGSDQDPLDDTLPPAVPSRPSSTDHVQFRMEIKQEPEETIAPSATTHPIAMLRMISPPAHAAECSLPPVASHDTSRRTPPTPNAASTPTNLPALTRAPAAHASASLPPQMPSLRIAPFAKEPQNPCSSLLIDRNMSPPVDRLPPPMAVNAIGANAANSQQTPGPSTSAPLMATRKSSRIGQSYTNTHRSLNELLANKSPAPPPIMHPTTVGQVQILPINVPKEITIQQRIPPPAQPHSISIQAGPVVGPRPRNAAPRKPTHYNNMSAPNQGTAQGGHVAPPPMYQQSQPYNNQESNAYLRAPPMSRSGAGTPATDRFACEVSPHITLKPIETAPNANTQRARKRRLDIPWNEATAAAQNLKMPRHDNRQHEGDKPALQALQAQSTPSQRDGEAFNPNPKEVEFFDSALSHLGSSLRQLQREMISEFFQNQMELARKEHEFQMQQDMLLMRAFEEQSRTLIQSARDLMGDERSTSNGTAYGSTFEGEGEGEEDQPGEAMDETQWPEEQQGEEPTATQEHNEQLTDTKRNKQMQPLAKVEQAAMDESSKTEGQLQQHSVGEEEMQDSSTDDNDEELSESVHVNNTELDTDVKTYMKRTRSPNGEKTKDSTTLASPALIKSPLHPNETPSSMKPAEKPRRHDANAISRVPSSIVDPSPAQCEDSLSAQNQRPTNVLESVNDGEELYDGAFSEMLLTEPTPSEQEMEEISFDELQQQHKQLALHGQHDDELEELEMEDSSDDDEEDTDSENCDDESDSDEDDDDDDDNQQNGDDDDEDDDDDEGEDDDDDDNDQDGENVDGEDEAVETDCEVTEVDNITNIGDNADDAGVGGTPNDHNVNGDTETAVIAIP